jgi:hypothetical protein
MLTTFVDPVIVPRNVDVVADRFVIVPFVTTSFVEVVVPVVRFGIVPVVIVAAVDVVVPNVPVGMTPVVIVPDVKMPAVPVVVPVVRVGINPVVIVPDVKMPAVPVVVPAVSVGIVPSVMLAVLDVKLAIVPLVLVRARLEVGTASATKALSFNAVTSLVTPSVNEVPAVKLGIV